VSALLPAGGPLLVLMSAAGPGEHSPAERRAGGRALVADAVGRLFGADPASVVVTARCARCGGDHGRPLISLSGRELPAWASVSHAGAVSVAAVSDRRVGIDAEPVAGGAGRFDAIRALAGPWAADAADGPEALRAWTIVEAVLKADGRGLEVDPGRVLLDGRPGRVGTTASVDGSGPVYAVSTAVVDGLVLSVAAELAAG
jgi:4'-phosphopantetheinyl transferase